MYTDGWYNGKYMFSGVTSIVFIGALGVIVFLLLLRFLEVKMHFSLLGSFDKKVQKGVSYLSVFVLKYSVYIKRFLLVHLYHVSAETTKSLLRQGAEKRETILEKLRGNKPKPAGEKNDENVSPYLREISRIDRKEE